MSNQKQNPNLLSEEQVAAAESAGLIVPVDAPTINPNAPSTFSGSPIPSGRDPYNSGTLPPNFGLQPDLVDAAPYGPSIPAHRLMPVAQTPQQNSAIHSVVQNVIQSTSVVQDIVSSSPTTTAPTAQPFDNSDNLANTQYVDEEAFYGVGVAGFRDDFFCPNTSFDNPGSIPTSFVGDTPWLINAIDGATDVFLTSEADLISSNPSLIGFGTGTLATVGQGLVLFKVPSLGVLGLVANWQIDIIVAAFFLGSPGCMRIGLVGNNGPFLDPPSYGVWIRFDTAAGDTKFTWECRSSGTSTTSTANSITADSNPHHFRIRSVVAGTILFSVDGGAETAISTNVPGFLVSLGPFMQGIVRQNSTGVEIFTDFFSYIARTGRT
jgi:hypothetical protein